jgi:dTDP-4-amino-4,6-dideoxygalactose transaminase
VATAAVGAGKRILLYDVEPRTLGPDLESLERVLQEGARTVVLSPLFGIPIDWGAAEAVANQYGAVMVEDAAQGHGAFWRGRRLGSLGPVSVLSFGRGKGWAGAGGGALLTRSGANPDAKLQRRRSPGSGELRVLLLGLAQQIFGHPAVYGLPSAIPWLGLGETRYKKPLPLSEMARASARLLEITRAEADRESAVRRRNAGILLEAISRERDIEPVQAPPGGELGYLRLPLRVRLGHKRLCRSKRARRLGILAAYPAVLDTLEAVRTRLVNRKSRWPGAEELVRELVTVPTHSLTTATDRRKVLRVLNTFAGG